MLVQNPDATEAIRSSGNLTLSEGYPQNMRGDIKAVMDMTPRTHRFNNVIASAASGTIYTTPTDRDFFLTGIDISGSKAVGDSGTVLSLLVNIDGIARTVSIIQKQTVTAESTDKSVQFAVPFKLTRGSVVTYTLTGTWTITQAIVMGYTVAPF